jgi:hypothetical protein
MVDPQGIVNDSVPVTPEYVACTVTVPEATAVTSPVDETVASELSDVVHVEELVTS